MLSNVVPTASVNSQLFEEASTDVVEGIVELCFGRLEAALKAHDVLELLSR